MELEKAFGIVLKNARKKRGITQDELAYLSGFHRTAISLLERGERKPTLHTVFALAKILNHQPDKLIAEVRKMNPDIDIPKS